MGWKVSYEKLIKFLKRECGEDIKCFAYGGVDETNTKQKKFLDMLDIIGYITRVKSVKKIQTKDGNIKELLERAKFIDLRKIKNEISQ